MASNRDVDAALNDSIDQGFTHVALPVKDIERSVEFYRHFARMEVVHDRHDSATGTRVVWLTDATRPFVLVLIQTGTVDQVLGGAFCHLGIAVRSREEVDRLCVQAEQAGRPVYGPFDSGPPVGYWAFIVDPDGHNLEVSYGQVVGTTVRQHHSPT